MIDEELRKIEDEFRWSKLVEIDEDVKSFMVQGVQIEQPTDKRVILLYKRYDESMRLGLRLLDEVNLIQERLEGWKSIGLEKPMIDAMGVCRKMGEMVTKKALLGLYKAKRFISSQFKKHDAWSGYLSGVWGENLLKGDSYVSYLILKRTEQMARMNVFWDAGELDNADRISRLRKEEISN